VRVTADPVLAEDLAQDTFLKAFRNLSAYDANRPFSNWLFRIAHNTAIDATRRAHMTTVPLENEERLPQGAPPIAAPADGVETAALAHALEAALARVRPEYRSAIVLRYQEGLSFDEIGQIMSIPSATARTYVHRARKELAQLLTDAGWKPTGWA
jgi:RNA polymerase sigma-70 factor, ECF subfamily